MRCRSTFRRRFLNSTEHISDVIHTSFYQEQDGEPEMSNSPMYTRRRYTPYGIPSNHQRINLQKRNQMYANREGGPTPGERKMERDKQDDTSKKWFKVTIPFGIKYDEKWLLNTIQNQCSIPFTPVEPQTCRTPSVILQLAVDQEETTSQQDMQTLPSDKGMTGDLMPLPTDLTPNPGRYMAPSLDNHEEDITLLLPLNQSYNKCYEVFGLLDTMAMAPAVDNLNVSINEVKSAAEIVKRQDLNPEEIHADKSSLRTNILDKSSNINSILELFPKLLSLDGQESSKPTPCGLEDHKSLPTCKGSFFGSEAIKILVLQFLQQYYFIYDNRDRRGLLNAYHAEACFSLTVLFSSMDSTSSSLWEYFNNSRNMKVLKDPYMQRKLLKHKKCDIIYFLCTLPKTQHDLTSFVVDIYFQTETMLCFSVSGLFKEVEGSSQGCVHAFTRIFIATYGNSSDLCIINDKLFVRNVQGLSSASIPVTTSSSYFPALSQDQQKVLQVIYTQSGMNIEWSQKCLNDE